MPCKREPSHMAGQIGKVAMYQVPQAELRIVEVTASSGMLVRLQGVSAATAPRAGEKNVVVVAVEKPQPTSAE